MPGRAPIGARWTRPTGAAFRADPALRRVALVLHNLAVPWTRGLWRDGSPSLEGRASRRPRAVRAADVSASAHLIPPASGDLRDAMIRAPTLSRRPIPRARYAHRARNPVVARPGIGPTLLLPGPARLRRHRDSGNAGFPAGPPRAPCARTPSRRGSSVGARAPSDKALPERSGRQTDAIVYSAGDPSRAGRSRSGRGAAGET